VATLRGEIRSFFDRLPTGEFSHHNQVLTPLALIVSKFIDDPQKASDLIEKLLENTNHRPHQANEVLNLVVGAKNHLANPNRPRTKRVKTEIDKSLQESSIGYAGLFDEYSLRSDIIPRNAADALGGLFDSDDVIFIQPELFNKPLEFCNRVDVWTKLDLSNHQYTTYNPSIDQPNGRNEQNLKCRKYLLHEIDDEGISFEEQLGFIQQLESIAPLKMIVNSGGKSLHAWFKWVPGRRDEFLTLSQKLGGDSRFANSSQLCRLPWGTRRKESEKYSAQQPILFWRE
tara:strand:+ start:194 stop:1051 length:858 start_codon:yes stop_codon:yes gene_type:complete